LVKSREDFSQAFAHFISSTATTPKAAEDRRSPKREAGSDLGENSTALREAAQHPNVRQLLDCASPLALSPQTEPPNLRRYTVTTKKRRFQSFTHRTSSPPNTTPKAAEDRRSPKREAVSDLGEDSIAFRQAAQPPNVRQLLDCACPLALSPQTEPPNLRRNTVTTKKRRFQSSTHRTSSPPNTTPKAAEDRRSPKREAVSDLGEDSRAFRQAAFVQLTSCPEREAPSGSGCIFPPS
jgi:hypothetical protein